MTETSLKLIKDLENYKLVYYWACSDQGKVSPDLPTLLHASEWIIQHQATTYEGSERRKTLLDRRKKKTLPNNHETELVFSRRLKPEGRRITDTIPKVDLDLSAEKLLEMKNDFLN